MCSDAVGSGRWRGGPDFGQPVWPVNYWAFKFCFLLNSRHKGKKVGTNLDDIIVMVKFIILREI